MKNFSIITSVILILASFFYWLIIISNDNKCSSVRKYSPECKTSVSSWTTLIQPESTWAKVNSWEQVTEPVQINQEKTLDYALVSYILINTSSYFIAGYETWFDRIIDKGLYYEVVYSWKDKIIVDIAKDKNKVISVSINWISMPANEITDIFSKYYE